MWEIPEKQILHLLLGAGGDLLPQCVDSLISAEARLGGLTPDQIRTQLRSVNDKGVDSCVDQAVPKDGSGWLSVPTCWQYKATNSPLSPKALKKEINKSGCRDLIKRGYGYRLCLASTAASPKVKDYESRLLDYARAIQPDCTLPRVIVLSDIARWVARIPFASSIFGSLPTSFIDMKMLQVKAEGLTSHYVPIKEWANIESGIARFADFSKSVSVPCLAILGCAGVGKTRFVYETLRKLDGIQSLIGYSDNEVHVLGTVQDFVRKSDRHAIIIADECTFDTRMRLAAALQGSTDRLRVIAIRQFINQAVDCCRSRLAGQGAN